MLSQKLSQGGRPMSARPVQQINQAKLEAFLGKVVGDLGAAMSVSLSSIGDKLGLYKAMAKSGPVTSAELAKQTATAERYVREWLINQAAGGYIEYDPATRTYTLPYEHAVALTDEDSPFFVGGGFQLTSAVLKAQFRIEQNFKSGAGMLWGEHDPELFRGTERFFRASYLGHLVQSWLPALDGVVDKLQSGATVADVGCGHGASTIIMATAFPKSTFYGFDNHEPSIERARQAATEAGVSGRVTFETATATAFPDRQFNLIAFFDCLHDMGDPLGALKRSHATLRSDGTVMVVEPMAGATTEENFNPVGRVYSGASVLCCTPNALASGPIALGTIPPDAELEKIAVAAGFSRFRRATETPFNRIFELRP
jgi:2-polyprenyl-3-methyl-5-hydroxy-6-metoxy-1,4-benzoquinol methylase